MSFNPLSVRPLCRLRSAYCPYHHDGVDSVKLASATNNLVLTETVGLRGLMYKRIKIYFIHLPNKEIPRTKFERNVLIGVRRIHLSSPAVNKHWGLHIADNNSFKFQE